VSTAEHDCLALLLAQHDVSVHLDARLEHQEQQPCAAQQRNRTSPLDQAQPERADDHATQRQAHQARQPQTFRDTRHDEHHCEQHHEHARRTGERKIESNHRGEGEQRRGVQSKRQAGRSPRPYSPMPPSRDGPEAAKRCPLMSPWHANLMLCHPT
jgi:hypothetical protein